MTQNAKDLLSNLVAATSKKLMVPQHHNSIKGELKYKKEAGTNIKKEDMHLHSDKRGVKNGDCEVTGFRWKGLPTLALVGQQLGH